MSDGSVVGAWRYPVKSLGGEPLTDVAVEPRGVRGDRVLAVYGADRKIGSGKPTRRFRRMDGLLDFAARSVDGIEWVRTPDRSEHPALDAASAAALSRHLGEPVTIEREAGVAHFDVAPLLLLTRQALRWLASRLGAAEVDVARFRPNLLLDAVAGDAVSRVEDTWVGREIEVGSARLLVRERAERCVMVSMAQPGLAIEGDERVLRVIARESDACFGVYAEVLNPGRVRVGDTFTIR